MSYVFSNISQNTGEYTSTLTGGNLALLSYPVIVTELCNQLQLKMLNIQILKARGIWGILGLLSEPVTVNELCNQLVAVTGLNTFI